MAIPMKNHSNIIQFSDHYNKTQKSELNRDERRENTKEQLEWIKESMFEVIRGINEVASTLEDDKEKATSKCEKSEKISNTCEEVEIMKLKAKQPIPKAIIIYIIASTMGVTFFTTIFIIMIIFKIKILDLESCIVGILSTIGLLVTSVVSIKDWRDFVRNV